MHGPADELLGGVRWEWSYDRGSLEEYLRGVEQERHRLEAALADARVRAAHARQGQGHDRSLEEELVELVDAGQRAIAELEGTYRARISFLHETAERECARIAAEARIQADAIRELVAVLGEQASIGRDE